MKPHLASLLLALSLNCYLCAQPQYYAGTDHFYELVPVQATWDVAKTNAQSMSIFGHPGYLATITSPGENAFVHSLTPTTIGTWIGGFQPSGSLEPDANWQWVTNEPFDYTDWRLGEPNNLGDENALQILPETQWNDADGNENTFYYVVEYSVPEPATIVAPALLCTWLIGRRRRKICGTISP